jgi:hypothetical protein
MLATAASLNISGEDVMSDMMNSTDDLREKCCELLHERTLMSLFTAGPSAKSGQAFLTSGDASNPGLDASQCTPTSTTAGMLASISPSCQTTADVDPGLGLEAAFRDLVNYNLGNLHAQGCYKLAC